MYLAEPAKNTSPIEKEDGEVFTSVLKGFLEASVERN